MWLEFPLETGSLRFEWDVLSSLVEYSYHRRGTWKSGVFLNIYFHIFIFHSSPYDCILLAPCWETHANIYMSNRHHYEVLRCCKLNWIKESELGLKLIKYFVRISGLISQWHKQSYFLSYRVAGTAGAVVTCPLEVVKTRLQSSNAFLPLHASRISELPGMQNPTSDALRRPEQRRKFSSTILRRSRPQVNLIHMHATRHDTLSYVPRCPPFFFSVPFQKSPTKTLRKHFFDKIRLKMNVICRIQNLD